MTSRTPGGRSIHWTTRTHGEQGHFYWVHMWQASCILLGSALPSSESIFIHFSPFLSQCNLNILQNKLPHCQLSPSHSTGGYFFAKFKSFVPQYPGPPYWIRILNKLFQLTDIPDTTNSELRSTQVRCMNRQSHSVGLNWIEFDTAEMQRMKRALLRFSDSTLHMYEMPTFSHVGKAFHPIRNQLSKCISQFATPSRWCWHLFNLYSQKFVEFP